MGTDLVKACRSGAFYRNGRVLPGRSMQFALRLMFALMFSLCALAAKADDAVEYAIKGTFLAKFGDFVEWPAAAFPQPDAPFVIGILGEDPFGSSLDKTLENRSIQGRKMVVVRYKRIEQAGDAHILFIARDTPQHRDTVLTELRKRNVLTVTDKSKRPDGIINFVIHENRVRFEIDADAAEQAGLKLSSKLLSLAVATRK